MRRIWIIARNEYLTNIRRAGFLIMTAIFPLIGLIVLLIAAFFRGQASTFLTSQFEPKINAVGVVDRSGLFTPILPEYADIYRLYADEASGEADLRASTIDALLVFPENYLETGMVIVIVKGAGFSTTAIQESESTRSFILDHLLRGKVEESLRLRVSNPIQAQLVILSSTGSKSSSDTASTIAGFMVPYFISLLLVISIFVSSGYLQQSVSEEKENRVIEILLSSVSSTELLAGKIIGLGAMGLTQMSFWLLSGWGLSALASKLLAFSIPLFTRADILAGAITYYLLGFSLFAVLMAVAGSLGSSMRESQQIGGLFSFAAAIPYMANAFVFANPDSIIPRVLSWIPLTAPTMMMLRLPLSNNLPWVDIAVSLIGLLVSIPLALWAGAKIFRMGLLMYGKRPSLAQIWSSLKQA